ncbi:hypothetical protein HDU86_004750 [Geranomyces michiganensis]|nr:hypothetical protein HDU86_004750 [Geranomyces michiganensis]
MASPSASLHRPQTTRSGNSIRRRRRSLSRDSSIARLIAAAEYETRVRALAKRIRDAQHQSHIAREHADEIADLRAKVAAYRNRVEESVRVELSKVVKNLVRTSEREQDRAHDRIGELARINAALQDLVAQYERELDSSQRNYARAQQKACEQVHLLNAKIQALQSRLAETELQASKESAEHFRALSRLECDNDALARQHLVQAETITRLTAEKLRLQAEIGEMLRS